MTTPAVVARDVAKVYRRFMHRNQFKTLKSALLTGSVIRDQYWYRNEAATSLPTSRLAAMTMTATADPANKRPSPFTEK